MTASAELVRNRSRALPWLIVLALVLYLPGFWWGAPQATAEDRIKAWAVDDETPLGPLAEVHNIIAPRPDRNLGYPLLYSFLVVGVQAPYLLYLKASGGLGATGAEYPFGLTEPVGALRTLTWLAHLLTLVMAAVVIAAAYDTARVLWGERAAILAAVFAWPVAVRLIAYFGGGLSPGRCGFYWSLTAMSVLAAFFSYWPDAFWALPFVTALLLYYLITFQIWNEQLTAGTFLRPPGAAPIPESAPPATGPDDAVRMAQGAAREAGEAALRSERAADQAEAAASKLSSAAASAARGQGPPAEPVPGDEKNGPNGV